MKDVGVRPPSYLDTGTIKGDRVGGWVVLVMKAGSW